MLNSKVADWTTDGVFNWKNPTQMQEVYQIFLQRSYAQVTPLWTFHEKEDIPPLC